MSDNILNLNILKNWSDEELRKAMSDGFKEAQECSDEDEWKIIRDTIILIGEELDRRQL